MAEKKKRVRGQSLPDGNWWEAASHLKESKVKGTVWELDEVSPQGLTEQLLEPMGMTTYTTGDKTFKFETEMLYREIKRNDYYVRPIMIDEIRPEGPWVEGLHRIAAAMMMGLDTIPAYIRVK